MGLLLIIVSIADGVLELSFYNFLLTSDTAFIQQLQSPVGICIRDVIGLVAGVLSCFLHYNVHHYRWIVRVLVGLLIIVFPVTVLLTRGSIVHRVDGLINATLILTAMVVYTALQVERSERKWQKIRDTKPTVLDLKLVDVRQWFNPIEIGPKLELNQEISSVVDRFLSTAKQAAPLVITVRCPNEVSESMQSTMQEVFQMYYMDEEQRINKYLERRYIRVMALVIISIIAMTIWINFSPSNDEGVTWTILSNFAAFSLWQIGNTYFERSDGYDELLRARIAKQVKLQFWSV